MTEYTRKAVKETFGALDEAYEQGKKVGRKVKREIIDPVGGYVEARQQQKAAEKEARIMDRAREIKHAHPNVPGKKAIKHARNESEAGMLDD